MTVTKAELAEQVSALEDENARLKGELEEAKSESVPAPVADSSVSYDGGHTVPTGHGDLEVNDAGFAVEKQWYPNTELPAHARPENLDPAVNGPFLDEQRAVEEANRRETHEKYMALKAANA